MFKSIYPIAVSCIALICYTRLHTATNSPIIGKLQLGLANFLSTSTLALIENLIDQTLGG